MKGSALLAWGLLLVGISLPMLASAESLSEIDFSTVVDQSSDISMVRVTLAEYDSSASFDCRFRYKVETIEIFKGSEITEFYTWSQAVVGSRYLLIGQRSSDCGELANKPTLDLPDSYPLLPVLPYGFDRKDRESWIALGPSNFRFPAEVDVVEGSACYLPSGGNSINTCLLSPPVANYLDVKELLRDLISEKDPLQLPGAL